MATEIKLPLPAEEIETVEVAHVRVSVGDVVVVGQALLEVEVEKSTVEVPAPMAGRVTKIMVKNGDQLHVGQTFCLIEPAEVGKKDTTVGTTPPPSKQQVKIEPKAEKAETSGARPASVPAPPVTKLIEKPKAGEPAAISAAKTMILAGPATRQLARELGVDLEKVAGSGRDSRVSPEDIKDYVRQQMSKTSVSGLQAEAVATPPMPDFGKWGPIERQPLDKVRRLTIQQMNRSWSLIPHVTQHDQADITTIEDFRKKQGNREPKLTVTAFALKAAAIALQQFPAFNASLDLAEGQLILKHYYHIGVAVDTERGLLVPVLQDVDKKNIGELARELAELAKQAREGKAPMRGGTFTISNLGGVGGTGFTPIINHPEVAILGISRAQLQPVVQAGQIVVRMMLPLSLSYDHRVIDGAAAARFARRISELLENPLQMLLPT